VERAEICPARESFPRQCRQVLDVPMTQARHPSIRLANDSVPECPAEELNGRGAKGFPGPGHGAPVDQRVASRGR